MMQSYSLTGQEPWELSCLLQQFVQILACRQNPQTSSVSMLCIVNAGYLCRPLHVVERPSLGPRGSSASWYQWALVNHYPGGPRSLKPGWTLSKESRILRSKFVISMSLKVNKNILSTVGITYPECRIDSSSEHSSELFLAQKTLTTSSLRIFYLLRTSGSDVFSNSAKSVSPV